MSQRPLENIFDFDSEYQELLAGEEDIDKEGI